MSIDVEQSAVALARQIAKREVSCTEVTKCYLARIAELNPTYHAFVTVGHKRALLAAALADKLARTKDVLPPFFGVPTGIKDLNFAREFPTNFGSAGMRLRYLPIDDRLTKQIRAGGFIVVGKLATSELGALPVTEPTIHPPTVTPWSRQLGHSAGGSSGGSGAAVAARMLPIAPGSDGAGSIRIPAAFNGLVGIKPSRGRVKNAFGLPDKTILYSDGPLARSVGDAAALLDVLSGNTAGTKSWAPASNVRFADCLHTPNRPLKIRVTYHHQLGRTDPQIEAAVRHVVSLCGHAGWQAEAHDWVPVGLAEFLPIWQRSTAIARFLLKPNAMQPTTRWLKSHGTAISADEAERRKQTMRDQVAAWWGDTDIWLTPTVYQAAPALGLAGGDDPEAAFHRVAPIGGFTAPFNLSGQPALSLPLGLTADGLPMGLQIVGRMYDEATIIGLAHMLETKLGKLPSPFATAAVG